MATRFKSCSIADCNGNAHHTAQGRRGWCSGHYMRWKRHGDPLAGSTGWREAQRFLLDVVLMSDSPECLIWPYSTDRNGYGQIRIDGRLRSVSRYVCAAIHGEPASPDLEAAHNCGKGSIGCVNPRHLRWDTHVNNVADTLAHGTRNRGEKQGSSVLTREKVREIRALKDTMLKRDIAKLYGVSSTAISSIHSRRSWAWLE